MSGEVLTVDTPPSPLEKTIESTTTTVPSSQSGYVSLLSSCETPDGPVLSLPQRATLGWSRTFDTFRLWSTRTLKYTRQILQERFGNVTRTQDIELEQNIQLLHETKRRYESILKEARQMSIYFSGLLQTQRSLGESLGELQRISSSSDDLVDQLVRNSQCQKNLALHGENLLNSINTFVDKLQTLTSKTMEDTVKTIKIYEDARIEYDACRYDYEILLHRNQINEDLERQYQYYKQRYEKCKDDVTVKLKLLEENRIQVMKQQLYLFHNAIGGYFSINRQQLNM